MGDKIWFFSGLKNLSQNGPFHTAQVLVTIKEWLLKMEYIQVHWVYIEKKTDKRDSQTYIKKVK